MTQEVNVMEKVGVMEEVGLIEEVEVTDEVEMTRLIVSGLPEGSTEWRCLSLSLHS